MSDQADLDTLNEVDMERFIEGEDLESIKKSPTIPLTKEQIASVEARIEFLKTFLKEIES